MLSTIATGSLGRIPTATGIVHGYTLAFGVSAGLAQELGAQLGLPVVLIETD